MKKTYKMMMACLTACMLMTTLPISGQLINKESNNISAVNLLSFREDDGRMKMPKADSDWKSLGTATFTDNYLCKNSYQVELQQHLSNPQWYRLVQPYHQAKVSEGWNSKGTPAEDLQFQLLKKGDNWSVYRDSAWVTEPMEHDSLVWFPWRSTGYYDTFTYDGSSRIDNLRISHPGYWQKWSPQDSILHNRVLSFQSSGYPDVVQLAPRYYINNLGGWDYTQKDGIVLIKFPTIKTVVINVSTPGTMSNVLFAEIDNWTDVRDLTIIGHINKEDMKFFSRLTKLERLDLSQTDITSITGCNGLSNLTTCILPSTVITVEDDAFNGCTNLQGINLPNAVTIGNSAFYNCGKITEIELPNAETIGESAFYCPYYNGVYPSSLKSISLPKAVTIGNQAFSACSSLTTVSLPQAVTIGYNAFSACSSLTTVSLPQAVTIGNQAFSPCSSLTTVSLPQAETIGFSAFQSCSSLTTVSLPQAVTIGDYDFYACRSLTTVSLPQAETIGNNAFSACSSLTTVSLPATLLFIGNAAFASCSNLSDVYCYMVVPISTTAFDNTGSKNTTLHVPAFSHTAYRLHESWYKFNSIVTMEGLLDNITINSDFSINSSNGLASPVDINIKGCDAGSSSSVKTGHLTIATPDIHVGKLTMENSYYYNYYSRPYFNTLINHSPVSIDAVDIDLNVETRRWNFLSFPFDVEVSSIEAPDSALWVIRKYSGADRAALTGNTWQNMSDGTTLKAYEGYILHCTDPTNNYSIMSFKIHAKNNASKGNILACDDVTVPLSSYPSEKAHNRSWNLVGNPYPCFYYTTAIEHQGVITIWNGNGYTAYSLLDDDYVLSPFEAFFVQCPEGAMSMTFHADGRSHTENSESSSNATSWRSPSHGTRQVYNLLLTDGEYTDRTRLVVNENAKMDYETECDASKFMSEDSTVPQLYITDNGIRYAIDERPMGDGVLHLGVRTGHTDEYTIHLQAKPEVSDPVLLTDNITGETADLTENDYTFTSQASENEQRFTLIIGDATGISEVASGSANCETYTLDGKRMPNGILPGGIYVVRQNGKAAKKVVK